MDNEIIRVGTFNVKDNKINRNGGIREDGIDNTQLMADEIEKFDLLGTQELTIKFVNALKLKIGNYKLYGNYRYGKLLAKMPYNENNNIITNKKVVSSKTVMLPWIANNIKDLKTSIVKMSIMPRIATIAIVEDSNGNQICMINTHLDYQVKSIQIRQLEALKKLINKYKQKYPIILTGDFNMELTDDHFKEFVDDIKPDLQHVTVSDKTWHGNNGEETNVDHIFVSNEYEVQDKGVISSNGISDHDILYADIRKK